MGKLNQLKNISRNQVKTYPTTDKKYLDLSTDAILSFFELLMEIDHKLKKINK